MDYSNDQWLVVVACSDYDLLVHQAKWIESTIENNIPISPTTKSVYQKSQAVSRENPSRQQV